VEIAKLIRRSRTYTAAIIRQTSKCGYAVETRWTQEKNRRPRKTWRQTFREDLQEMPVSWSGVRRVAGDRSRWRSLVGVPSRRPMLQQEWEDLSLIRGSKTEEKLLLLLLLENKI